MVPTGSTTMNGVAVLAASSRARIRGRLFCVCCELAIRRSLAPGQSSREPLHEGRQPPQEALDLIDGEGRLLPSVSGAKQLAESSVEPGVDGATLAHQGFQFELLGFVH